MKVLSVYFHGLGDNKPALAGRLTYHQGLGQFEYSQEFLDKGVNLSPFFLKPHNRLQPGSRAPFNGLHGMFSDSLPDGWGLYLMDKVFRQHGIDPQTATPIDRLAYMGNRAMGALSYAPDEGAHYSKGNAANVDLNQIAAEALNLYTGNIEEVLEQLSINGTPSGGARPKMLVGLHNDQIIAGAEDLPSGYEHWIAKFPTGTKHTDRSEGAIEYIYSQMARSAGIEMPDTRLIPGESGNAYFLTKRFDRKLENVRVHSHSLAGLIHADFRVPDCDYELLMKVCSQLTKSHEERKQLLRRMIFNIISGNRDDHTKNFSFTMNKSGIWQNSPAYDITYNNGINGEHTMSIAGHGKQIPLEAIIKVAKVGSITPATVNSMIEEISDSLSCWETRARELDIPRSQVEEISNYMNTQQQLLV